MVVSVNHEGSLIAKYQNIPVRMYIEALNRTMLNIYKKGVLKFMERF